MSAARQRAGRALAAAVLAGSGLVPVAPAWIATAWVITTGIMTAGIMTAGIVTAILVPGAAAAAATGHPAQAQEFTQLLDGTGRDLTAGRCIICHSLEYIPSNAPAMNRAGWEKTIQKMRDRFGAPITDDEARQVLDYLATNYSGKP